jgi:hypothetical protein
MISLLYLFGCRQDKIVIVASHFFNRSIAMNCHTRFDGFFVQEVVEGIATDAKSPQVEG